MGTIYDDKRIREIEKNLGNVSDLEETLTESVETIKENYVDGKLAEVQFSLDWNTLTKTGFYIYNGWSGSGGSNRPTDEKCMGTVIVTAKSDDTIITQTFIRSSGEIYTRMYAGGNWGDWSTNSK